jgi:pimeloyl-ACP methyl ester carboxylesterase
MWSALGELDRVQVGSLSIAFEWTGEGVPLVLLHGGVSDSRQWRQQLEGLSDEFAVVAWDAPGCGRSSDPPDDLLMPDYADCLAGFVAALDLVHPHVVGLSFGGTLALELYRRHPNLPRTLVLASAYTGWAGSLPPEEVASRLDAVTRDTHLPGPQYAARWLPTLFTADAPRQLVEELGTIIADFHPQGARTMARAMATADLRDVLVRIDVPTLLLYGDADVRSSLTVAKELHARTRTSTLVVLPGVGHQLNMEAADRFNSVLRDFLHRHDAARRSKPTPDEYAD